MTSSPPLTVVMPVHNGMPFVEQSVRSILDQSWRRFELVIGDDASDDGTSEVLHRLAETDARIRLLRRETKSGLAGAANWVASAATAPVIAIAHADDVSAPTRLECQFQLLQSKPDAVMVGSVYQGIDIDGKIVHPPNLWRLIRRSPFASFAHSSVMFRRRAFELAGGYRSEADYWEDLDLFWRFSELGKVLVIPRVLVSYRYSPAEGKVEEDLLKESYVEHDGAKVLIADILNGSPSDDYYDSKVKVLSEEIEHHVKEEEQRMEGLFAQARKAGLDMDALGEQLAARKQELTAEFEANGVPQPTFKTLEEARP